MLFPPLLFSLYFLSVFSSRPLYAEEVYFHWYKRVPEILEEAQIKKFTKPFYFPFRKNPRQNPPWKKFLNDAQTYTTSEFTALIKAMLDELYLNWEETGCGTYLFSNPETVQEAKDIKKGLEARAQIMEKLRHELLSDRLVNKMSENAKTIITMIAAYDSIEGLRLSRDCLATAQTRNLRVNYDKTYVEACLLIEQVIEEFKKERENLKIFAQKFGADFLKTKFEISKAQTLPGAAACCASFIFTNHVKITISIEAVYLLLKHSPKTTKEELRFIFAHEFGHAIHDFSGKQEKEIEQIVLKNIMMKKLWGKPWCTTWFMSKEKRKKIKNIVKERHESEHAANKIGVHFLSFLKNKTLWELDNNAVKVSILYLTGDKNWSGSIRRSFKKYVPREYQLFFIRNWPNRKDAAVQIIEFAEQCKAKEIVSLKTFVPKSKKL